MKRIFTAATTAAMLAGVTASGAFAQDAQNPELTMLEEKVATALRECSLDEGQIDTLTMAQVAGITIANDSEDGSDKCLRIEAIARGE